MKTIEPRIKVQICPHPDVRSYHLTTEISKHSLRIFQRPLSSNKDLKDLEEVGELGTLLLREVFAIPGVSRVFIAPYELTVTKGSAFEWSEIEPDILEALKKRFKGTYQAEGAIHTPLSDTSPASSDIEDIFPFNKEGEA